MRRPALVVAMLLAVVAASCGQGGAPPEGDAADIFRERSEQEVSAALDAAKQRARREGKQVLLEFVAPWCTDCREVAKIAQKEPAASVLRDRYVVVPVDVGRRFDRNKALLREHDIKVIAALVVLDADGKRVAKTTLEPITKREALTAEELAAWLRAPTGS